MNRINYLFVVRFVAALEEAKTVDRIVTTLGEEALNTLAVISPLFGMKSHIITKNTGRKIQS